MIAPENGAVVGIAVLTGPEVAEFHINRPVLAPVRQKRNTVGDFGETRDAFVNEAIGHGIPLKKSPENTGGNDVVSSFIAW